jgi:hypothetical protein
MCGFRKCLVTKLVEKSQKYGRVHYPFSRNPYFQDFSSIPGMSHTFSMTGAESAMLPEELLTERPADAGYHATIACQPATASRIAGFYSGIRQRWASRLLAGSLFEPTAPELDRRDRRERLFGIVTKLRLESERRRTSPKAVRPVTAGNLRQRLAG